MISPIKKGIAVWMFGFFTFLAVLHTFDALIFFTFGVKTSLLEIYPFDVLKMDAVTYFWASLFSTFLLLGLTCIFAFQNAVETFLNKLLTDKELEGRELEEEPLTTFDMINNSLISNSISLQELKTNLSLVKDSLSALKIEMRRISADFTNFQTDSKKQKNVLHVVKASFPTSIHAPSVEKNYLHPHLSKDGRVCQR